MQPGYERLPENLVHGHEMQIHRHGDGSDEYIPTGRGLMVELVRFCTYNAIPQLDRWHRLEDGTVIRTRLIYGAQVIDIYPGDEEAATSGFYMDTGAIYERYASGVWMLYTTPLDLITSEYIDDHNSSGVTFGNDTVTLLPKISLEWVLCGGLNLPYWTEKGVVSTSPNSFESAVYISEEAGLSGLNLARKSWRYSGLARLFVQAKHGSGQAVSSLILSHPDTSGIICSDEGAVYAVRLSDASVSIHRLRLNIASCVVAEFVAIPWSNSLKSKYLAFMFSQSELDPEYEALNIDIATSEYGAPFCYGWHWPYNLTAECSQISAKMAKSLNYYNMTLLSITFDIPTKAAELEGSSVTITETASEPEGFRPAKGRDMFWASNDEDHMALYDVGSSFSIFSEWIEPIGENVGVYCFYDVDGLQILTYYAPRDTEQAAFYDGTRYCAPGTTYNLLGWTYNNECSPGPPWLHSEATYTREGGGFSFKGKSFHGIGTSSHSKQELDWTFGPLEYYGTEDQSSSRAHFQARADTCDWVRIADCTYDCLDPPYESTYDRYDYDHFITREIFLTVQAGKCGATPAYNNPDSMCLGTYALDYRTGTTYQYNATTKGRAWNVYRYYNVMTVTQGNHTTGKEGPNRLCYTYTGLELSNEPLEEEIYEYTARVFGVNEAYDVEYENDDWHFLYTIKDGHTVNQSVVEESFNGASVYITSPKNLTFDYAGGIIFDKAYIDGKSMLYFGWM